MGINDELKAALVRAELAEGAKQRLQHVLSVMSHELRNPLNAIFGMSQMLLRRTDATEEVKKNIRLIHDSSKDILPLLDHCLYYLSDAENPNLQMQTFDLRALLEEIIQHKYSMRAKPEVEIMLDYGHDIPRYINSDPARLSKAISFVIGNAIRFTHKGMILITVSGNQRDNRFDLTLTVEDSGLGIEAEKLNGIFDLFTVAETRHAHVNGGLRLSICKHLMDIFGGDVKITSQLGVGTKVKLTMPALVERVKSINNSQWDMYNDKVKILVINDKQRCAEVLYKYIASEKNRYCRIEDALNLFRESLLHNDPFQIFILDAHSVEQEEEKLTDLLMAIPKNYEVLFLVITNNEKTKHLTMLKSEVSTGVIDKPVLPSQFLAKLASHWFRFRNKDKANLSKGVMQYEPVLLLVEDNRSNVKVAKLMLEELGCKVDVAESGEQALTMMSRPDTNYDLIFMDIGLPGKNGYETAAIIKQNLANNYELPIVAMTAYVSEEDKAKCFSAGMIDILPKPVTIKQLETCLTTHISRMGH